MMGSRFSMIGTSQVQAAAERTLLALIAGANIRPKVFDVLLSFIDTPGDVLSEFRLSRISDESVGTSTTQPNGQKVTDPEGRAPDATGGSNYSVEPTYSAGADLLDFGLHQRATFRFIAAPESALVIPATANNALGMKSIISDATPNAKVTMWFCE